MHNTEGIPAEQNKKESNQLEVLDIRNTGSALKELEDFSESIRQTENPVCWLGGKDWLSSQNIRI